MSTTFTKSHLQYAGLLAAVGVMAFLLRPPGVLDLRGEPRPNGNKSIFIAELERKSAFGSVPLPVELPAGAELAYLATTGRDTVSAAEYQVLGLGAEAGWWTVCVDIKYDECKEGGLRGRFSKSVYSRKVAEIPLWNSFDQDIAKVYVGRLIGDESKAKPDEDYADDWIFHVKWAVAGDVDYLDGDGFWTKPE